MFCTNFKKLSWVPYNYCKTNQNTNLEVEFRTLKGFISNSDFPSFVDKAQLSQFKLITQVNKIHLASPEKFANFFYLHHSSTKVYLVLIY